MDWNGDLTETGEVYFDRIKHELLPPTQISG